MNDKHKSKIRSESALKLEQLRDAILEFEQLRLERIVGQAFDNIKADLLVELRNRQHITKAIDSDTVTGQQEEAWIEIESLSMLRKHVGGRFQNLKELWLASGLPVKEKKGEALGDFKLKEAGWLELSNWILKQGFEIALDERQKLTIRKLGS